jgi:hypothetical protein
MGTDTTLPWPHLILEVRCQCRREINYDVTMTQHTWELAGLALEGMAPGRQLAVPSDVSLEGRWLRSRALRGDDRLVSVPHDLLLRFTRILTAEEALAFARRFGVLRLHERRDGPVCCEPVAMWLQLARQARALLNAASALHRGETPTIDDWRVIYEAAAPSDVPWRAATRPPAPEEARPLLGIVMQEWLQTFDVRPVFAWWGRDPQIVFQRDLPTTLVMSLVMAVVRAEGLAICSACGRPYLRRGRQAKRGQSNYCSGCGRRAAWRQAARRWRQGISVRRTRPTHTRRIDAPERADKLRALAVRLGAPPRGRGAGAYWRRFHTRASALGLVHGCTPIASRLAYQRARRRADRD